MRLKAVLLGALLPVCAAAQTLVVDPVSLFFSVPGAGFTPAQQVVSVTISNGSSVSFTLTASAGPWLEVTPASGFTPGSVRVTVNPGGLAAGSYSGSIVITTSIGARLVPVTLFVGDMSTGIVVAPLSMSFTAQVGGPAPESQLALVNSAFGIPTTYTATVFGAGWLSVSPVSSITPGPLIASVNPAGLAQGVYNAVISVAGPLGQIAQTIHVTLKVTGLSPITVSPGSLAFRAELGSTASLSQSVVVASTTGTTLSIQASTATTTGGAWLSVTPTVAPTDVTLAVSANPSGLGTGTYSGTVTITAAGSLLTVPVTLTVGTDTSLVASPGALAFAAGFGGPAATQNLTVDCMSGAALPFTAFASGGGWLSVSPQTATTSATLLVTANPAGLPPGLYFGAVTMTALGSSVQKTVSVSLSVTGQMALAVTPSAVVFDTQAGATTPLSQTLSIHTGSPATFNLSVSGGEWLSVSPSGGASPGSVTVTARPAGLPVGSHSALLTIAAPGAANSPQTVAVTLNVSPAGPAIASIVHAASLRAGVFAAGMAVTIFGRGLGPETEVTFGLGPDGKIPTSLGGVRVWFDGVAAPLLYAQARQLNAVIPFGLWGKTAAPVEVEYQGTRSAPARIQLFDAAPGVFTVELGGQGQGAIVNQDGTLNSPGNPAEAGSIVSVFATGGGQTEPPLEDGQIVGADPPRLRLPVSARVGDREADVTYAGGAPGLHSGVIQVNVRIPARAGPGIAVPLMIRVDRFSSQAGVTVAVR